jgi:hypothetical protein
LELVDQDRFVRKEVDLMLAALSELGEGYEEAEWNEVLALYYHLEEVIGGLGQAIVNPEKTRMSFAAVALKRQWIDGHVVLARRLESPRFRRIETISPCNHVHAFRLTCPQDIDKEFLAWLAEAYQVGEQRHLER